MRTNSSFYVSRITHTEDIMQFTKPVTEIIQQRISVRTYAKSQIEPRKEALLKECLSSNSTGPFQTNMRFKLMAARPEDVDALKGLGTYGMIRNPAGFIVGTLENSEKNFEVQLH